MKIEIAQKKDKKAILDFLVKLNKHERKYYKNFVSIPEFRKACNQEIDRDLDDKRFRFLIALQAKQPVGFIYGKIIETPRYKDKKNGVVAEMYVEPGERKKGVKNAPLKWIVFLSFSVLWKKI